MHVAVGAGVMVVVGGKDVVVTSLQPHHPGVRHVSVEVMEVDVFVAVGTPVVLVVV